MKEFTLDLLFRLAIGAASGIHYSGGMVFVVSDNSSYLYNYSMETGDFKKEPLLSDPSENIPKKDKNDFEVLAVNGDEMWIIGSGSTSKRNKAVMVKDGKNQIIDLSELYSAFKINANISDDDLNIEGAVFFKDRICLFQRGNGAAGRNGIFIVDDLLSKKPNISFVSIDLPPINGAASSFTDAVLVGNEIYFLATAERSNSTYLDGEVAGSLIGKMNADTFEVLCSLKISDTRKFEGLTFFTESSDTIAFLICEDNDSDKMDTGIYRITIKK